MAEVVLTLAAQPVDEGGHPSHVEPFVAVLVAAHDDLGPPIREGPAHFQDGAVLAGRVGRVVEHHHVEARCGGRQSVAQPAGLRRVGRVAVRLGAVAVDHEQVHQPHVHVVGTLVARQGEVVEVGAAATVLLTIDSAPVVVTQTGPEAIGRAAFAILPLVVAYELAVVLADVAVDGRGHAMVVVVVAGGDDERRVPTGHQLGHARLVDGVAAVVADDGELEAIGEKGGRDPVARCGLCPHGGKTEQSDAEDQ